MKDYIVITFTTLPKMQDSIFSKYPVTFKESVQSIIRGDVVFVIADN